MKTRLGVEFEIDFAHTLRGHPKCGKPHGHTSRIIVEVEGLSLIHISEPTRPY